MIWNVIDHRARRFRWKHVNAIIEAVEHDNSCEDADQTDSADISFVIDYERRDGISVHDAIEWANQKRCPVTLYLYDTGDDTTGQHLDFTRRRFPEDEELNIENRRAYLDC